MNSDDLIEFLTVAYAAEPWPKPFHVLQGCVRIAKGEALRDVAAAVGTTPARLEEIATNPDASFAVLGVKPSDLADADVTRARSILAQLIIGRAAEIAFEDIYRERMGSDVEFKLVDLREGRTDTDYRVLNGRDRGRSIESISNSSGRYFVEPPNSSGCSRPTVFRLRHTKYSARCKSSRRNTCRICSPLSASPI